MASTTKTGPEPEVSPLDRPLTVTTFLDRAAQTKEERALSLRDMVPRLRARTADRKDDLPWLKLARFGDIRTERGSLRNNANVQAIDGVEADYDQKQMPPDEAAERLRAAGLAAVVYTSPSHTPDKPRFRVLSPTSRQLPPRERERLVARVNGVLGGVLAGESFTLSQAYYFGSVKQQPGPSGDCR